MKKLLIIAALSLFGGSPRAFARSIPPPPPVTTLKMLPAVEFWHDVGREGSHGWQVDYRKDRPGYLLSAPKAPLSLEPGLYRAVVLGRRGLYPTKGLLHKTYGLFRVEIRDAETGEPLADRELQIGQFPRPNEYRQMWVEFAVTGSEPRSIQPRVYWLGLANGEVESVWIEKLDIEPARRLEEKADAFEERLQLVNLENGFVVNRRFDHSPNDVGDAFTYTAYYVCALSWKFAETRDQLTYRELENSLNALHQAVKGTKEEPLLVRFVDLADHPLMTPPSKDVYMAFFLAAVTANPFIKDPVLKKNIQEDIRRLGVRLLKDDWRIKVGTTTVVSLTPYFTEEEVRNGIHRLFVDKDEYKKILKGLKVAQTIVPFGELWPGSKAVMKALKRRDEQGLFDAVVPTMNGIFLVAERMADILREEYREDLFPRRFNNANYPGKKLEGMVREALAKFRRKSGPPFEHLQDLKVLASNAMIVLHLVKSAATVTKEPEFDEYYKQNLYGQDALLKAVEDWYGFDDELIALTAGNAAGDRGRRGYLGMMALLSASLQEKNPAVKSTYQAVIERAWKQSRNDQNPLFDAIEGVVCQHQAERALWVERALSEYSEDRTGFGPDYWKVNGAKIAEQFGGGYTDGSSREPLPVCFRPKDTFVWQRNSRRLSGDDVEEYPAVDYLFVYWFGRHYHLIEAPKAPALAAQDN